MNVYLKLEDNRLRLHYVSKYAAGSVPISSPQELVEEIEDICGKGSYCIYHRPPDFPMGFPKPIGYDVLELPKDLPRITYWQQGVKTQVIEQCRKEAIKLWGNIPEMQIGWIENMCKTYID